MGLEDHGQHTLKKGHYHIWLETSMKLIYNSRNPTYIIHARKDVISEIYNCYHSKTLSKSLNKC